VGTVLGKIRQAIELLLWPLDQLPPLAALSILSVITGVVLLWLVKKTSPQKIVGRARDQMTASIYEIRLYLDAPNRVFASQGRLIKWSAIYIGAMLPALFAAALPLGLLYLHLETRYGLDALEQNQSAMVRVDLAEGTDGSALVATGPSGLEISSTQVYIAAENAVFLKVTPRDGVSHTLTLAVDGETAEKRVPVAGSGERAAPDRLSGLGLLWQIGDEAPLDGAIEGIAVSHPASTRSWLGLPWWWAYWLLLATVAALLLRKRMDVSI